MNIAGSGSLPGGDYNEPIHISGSGKITGSVSCTELHIAGSGKVEGDLACGSELKISGSGKIAGSVHANGIAVAGSGSIGGQAVADGEVRIAGSLHSGPVRCTTLKISGTLHAQGDVSAEEAIIRGSIHAAGLINAEKVEITLGGDSDADSIGGSTITVSPREGNKGFFARLFTGGGYGTLTVANSIEGDIITLENTNDASVTGRIVKIGPNCRIGQVYYTEGIEISPESNVDRYDMING